MNDILDKYRAGELTRNAAITLCAEELASALLAHVTSVEDLNTPSTYALNALVNIAHEEPGTYRRQYAAAALTGMLASPNYSWSPDHSWRLADQGATARACFSLADEMIEAEKNNATPTA